MKIHPIEQNVRVATDAVILSVIDGCLMALLIQMQKEPYGGKWAFPGGLIGDGETSAAAAKRILRDQTGVSRAYLEQLAVFDGVDRDPFGRVISIGYYALVPAEGIRLHTTDKYADIRWWPAERLPALAYDHRQVAKVALARIREKIETSGIAWSLLPDSFTLTELQRVHESVHGHALDKRNFRKKILMSGLLSPLRRKRAEGAHRPAQLYRFKQAGGRPASP